MSFEDTARRAGHDLREANTPDIEAALAEFQRAVPRRRRAHAGGAMLSVAAALVIAVAATRWLVPDGPQNVQPAPQPQVTTAATPQIISGDGCSYTLITCHGGRRYTVALRVPMDWTLPREFEAPYSGGKPTTRLVETYSLTGAPGGVTVLQDVRAATNQQVPGPVLTVGSAKAFAQWLADRSFLSTSQVHTSTVAGRPAWSVDAVVKPGQPPGQASCTRMIDCYPIMLVDDRVVGTWEDMTNRYTVLDVPGAGITVLWSWGLKGELPPTADDLISSIRFR